jgi:hypothetical protein
MTKWMTKNTCFWLSKTALAGNIFRPFNVAWLAAPVLPEPRRIRTVLSRRFKQMAFVLRIFHGKHRFNP